MEGMAFDYLAKLLEPCPVEDFLNSSWGRSFKHVRGRPGRFSQLLPWDRLNEILGRHRLDFPRLRLTENGQSLPSSKYLRHVQAGRQKISIPRLLPAELTTQLRRGATLVLDAVDELHTPLEELAQNLELAFREHVQINAYAGWRTSRGFDLHWDDHDVFILQLTGRKRWSIYGMTRPFPLIRDVERAQKPEGAQPVWEETLCDGDLLYIPRGWWHVALPLNEPTLHLTVGIHNRTGLDLLRWMGERLRASEPFRMDLPRFASKGEREAHMDRLRTALMKECSDPELLERFFEDQDINASARPALSLPWSATPEVLSVARDAIVRLTAPRPLELKALAGERGQLEFSCLGKRWRFAADALLVLRPLNERRVCTVKELCEAAEGRLNEGTVRTFLGELILHGLLAIQDKPQP